MLKRMLCIAIIATIFCFSASMGETIINGPLTESQIWSPGGSPYIIQGVVVASDISFEIWPGTTVLFDPGAELIFYADCSLIAQGTEAAPILFSSNSASPQPDDYLGLFFDHDFYPAMSHCVIEYARNGLVLYSSIAVESVEIRNCINGLDIYYINGDVSGFYIHDNANFGIACHAWTQATFRDCIISANGSVGIQTYGPGSSIGADNCIIQNNGGVGMWATSAVTNCNISGNGGIGLVLVGHIGSAIIANNNSIFGNSGYGVLVYSASVTSDDHQIKWCSIYGNGEYDMVADGSCYSPTIDATHNFWNTQDAEIISARILDSNDDPDISTEVLFTPFEGSVATERKTLGEIKSLYR